MQANLSEVFQKHSYTIERGKTMFKRTYKRNISLLAGLNLHLIWNYHFFDSLFYSKMVFSCFVFIQLESIFLMGRAPCVRSHLVCQLIVQLQDHPIWPRFCPVRPSSAISGFLIFGQGNLIYAIAAMMVNACLSYTLTLDFSTCFHLIPSGS